MTFLRLLDQLIVPFLLIFLFIGSVGGDEMRTPLDLLVEAYPRPAGWIIAVSSLLVAVAIGLLAAARWLR